jgi:hypothetical protein
VVLASWLPMGNRDHRINVGTRKLFQPRRAKVAKSLAKCGSTNGTKLVAPFPGPTAPHLIFDMSVCFTLTSLLKQHYTPSTVKKVLRPTISGDGPTTAARALLRHTCSMGASGRN